MRSGEPSRISRPKRWISLTLRARLKWLARAITIARMLCTGWDLFVRRNFRQRGRGSDWFPDTFLAMIDWQKTIKLRDTNYFTPPPLLSLLFLSSLSSNQRFCNVYSQAAHFRSGFSGGEIHDLRRLRREGFPERLSRS